VETDDWLLNQAGMATLSFSVPVAVADDEAEAAAAAEADMAPDPEITLLLTITFRLTVVSALSIATGGLWTTGVSTDDKGELCVAIALMLLLWVGEVTSWGVDGPFEMLVELAIAVEESVVGNVANEDPTPDEVGLDGAVLVWPALMAELEFDGAVSLESGDVRVVEVELSTACCWELSDESDAAMELPAGESFDVEFAFPVGSIEVSADSAPRTNRLSRISDVPNRASEEKGLSSASFPANNRSRMASSHFITVHSVRYVSPEIEIGEIERILILWARVLIGSARAFWLKLIFCIVKTKWGEKPRKTGCFCCSSWNPS
jgi:hypothetical protein